MLFANVVSTEDVGPDDYKCVLLAFQFIAAKQNEQASTAVAGLLILF